MKCSDCKQFEGDWGYSKCLLGFWRINHDSKNPLRRNNWEILKELHASAGRCESFDQKD